MIKRVAVIGGGFAGLAALETLRRERKRVEVVLVDKQRCFNFLPLLPDTIGRRLPASLMTYPLERLCAAYRAKFIHDKAETIGAAGKSLHLARTGELDYDYLLLCCGSETNFYANTALRSSAYKLDNALDAQNINAVLSTSCFDNYVVCGGGYTGVEIATNLRLFLQEKGYSAAVTIVEKSPIILGAVPEWMRAYVLKNLKEMNIGLRTGVSISSARAERIVLSDGSVFGNSLLIWAAGVKTPEFIDRIPAQRTPQGRLKTDKFLRVGPNCFAAGDNTCFNSEGNCLRMSVQYAITQGKSCAENIINSICARPLREFKPKDYGYLIPLANDRACGKVLGKDIKGVLPLFLHYLLCLYRSRGLNNRVMLGLLLGKHVTQ